MIFEMDYFHIVLEKDELLNMGSLALAHVGDSVYDLLVRVYLAKNGGQTCGKLHKETVKRVNAASQSKGAQKIMPMLTEEELAVFKRGRNANSHHVPKNASRSEYRTATALETLFGYLYLTGEYDRINELFHIIIGEEDNYGV